MSGFSKIRVRTLSPKLFWVNDRYTIDPVTMTIYDEKLNCRMIPSTSFKTGKYCVFLIGQSTLGKEVPIEDIRAVCGDPKGKGWVIGSLGDDGQILFSEKPRVHPSEDSVNTEIERLATTYKGKTFVKLKVEAFVKSSGVVWS